MMKFVYNPRKAAQAAAYLVRLNNGQISMLSLIKLLYLADRKALATRGRPITGDRMVSMPHGPVLSMIYDEIKLGNVEGLAQPWYEYLTERQGNQIELKKADFPINQLSQFERKILEDTFAQYAHLGPAGLWRITHALPEYEDPQGSSLPIDPLTILKEQGWSEEEIREALMDARQEAFLQRITA